MSKRLSGCCSSWWRVQACMQQVIFVVIVWLFGKKMRVSCWKIVTNWPIKISTNLLWQCGYRWNPYCREQRYVLWSTSKNSWIISTESCGKDIISEMYRLFGSRWVWLIRNEWGNNAVFDLIIWQYSTRRVLPNSISARSNCVIRPGLSTSFCSTSEIDFYLAALSTNLL